MKVPATLDCLKINYAFYHVRPIFVWSNSAELNVLFAFPASRQFTWVLLFCVDASLLRSDLRHLIVLFRTLRSRRLSSKSASKTKRPERSALLPRPLPARLVSTCYSNLLFYFMMHTIPFEWRLVGITILPWCLSINHLSGLIFHCSNMHCISKSICSPITISYRLKRRSEKSSSNGQRVMWRSTSQRRRMRSVLSELHVPPATSTSPHNRRSTSSFVSVVSMKSRPSLVKFSNSSDYSKSTTVSSLRSQRQPNKCFVSLSLTLHMGEPHTSLNISITSFWADFSEPNLKSVRELIYKRGYGKVNKQRTPLTNNGVIEESLKLYDILSVEDLVHEIFTAGPNFKQASNFLWPFKLSNPTGGWRTRKFKHYVQGGDFGDRESNINKLIRQMNWARCYSLWLRWLCGRQLVEEARVDWLAVICCIGYAWLHLFYPPIVLPLAMYALWHLLHEN